jgi:O-methyltransferase
MKHEIAFYTNRATLKKVLPKWLLNFIRKSRDKKDFFIFLLNTRLRISLSERLRIVKKLTLISQNIRCIHTEGQILSFIKAVLSLPDSCNGCVVEVGTYKGGSTAKLSIAAQIANRELIVFDSFEGIPDNSEPHDKDIFGERVGFKRGDYAAALDEVRRNVAKFGKVEVCRFIKGYVEETLPHFKDEVAAVYLDVDLASSTKTCLKYLYPLLQPGGILYSQDAHLPLVVAVFDDDIFWRNEVGSKKPHIDGLGKKNLINIVKPPRA